MEALCRGVNVIIKDYLPVLTRMYYWCLRLRGQINTKGISALSTRRNLENMKLSKTGKPLTITAKV
jgi:hypothetical protein